MSVIAVPEQVSTKFDAISDPLLTSAMDGFLLVLSADGDMVFLSENVQDYLGLNQVTYRDILNAPQKNMMCFK